MLHYIKYKLSITVNRNTSVHCYMFRYYEPSSGITLQNSNKLMQYARNTACVLTFVESKHVAMDEKN
jgi:hypothetical protein